MVGPSVSVIIPVHNAAPYLSDAICSVLAQEEPAAQILVIDDGSTDSSGRIARRLPVHYVRQQHLGLAAARNRGVELARSDFVGFLDAEDLWMPAKLLRQLAAFDDDPELDLVGGHLIPLQDGPDCFEQTTPEYLWGTLLIRRADFLKVGPIATEPGVNECVDWFVRARQLEMKMGMLPDVVLRRRQPINPRWRAAAA